MLCMFRIYLRVLLKCKRNCLLLLLIVVINFETSVSFVKLEAFWNVGKELVIYVGQRFFLHKSILYILPFVLCIAYNTYSELLIQLSLIEVTLEMHLRMLVSSTSRCNKQLAELTLNTKEINIVIQLIDIICMWGYLYVLLNN